MPQAILPLFSDDMLLINEWTGVLQKEDTIYWYQGSLPVFTPSKLFM